MCFKPFFKRFLFSICFTFLSCFITFYFFHSLYKSSHVIIPYSLHPYDICLTYPSAWYFLKRSFLLIHSFSSFLIGNWLYTLCSSFFHKFFPTSSPKISPPPSNLCLLLGLSKDSIPIYLSEKSLYQNILITGTIGSGKTSSAMYPFTRQLISYSSPHKIGMLILDVKGNFYEKVLQFAKDSHRLSDVYIMELGGNITYNPLDKPHLKPAVIANRLKTILTLFSPNISDSYWLDKVEQTLTECIKFCRLYNNGYVTFLELHHLITQPNYYINQLTILKKKFLAGNFSPKDCYDILSSIQFFEKEFFGLDERTLSIIKSEITRITNCFVSDYDILHTFSPNQKDISFSRF